MSEAPERPMAAESRGEAPGRGRLEGRRILVVGGGQDDRGQADPPVGNGRAMSVLFAREGARVAVADRNIESAEATVGLAKDGSAVAIEANVAVPADIKTMVGEAVAKLGGLDGLVFNVGIGAGMWLEAAHAAIRSGRPWVILALAFAWIAAQSAAMRQLREAAGVAARSPLPSQPVPWQARVALGACAAGLVLQLGR